MIGQIIGSLGGLAKSYIDSKTQIKITKIIIEAIIPAVHKIVGLE